jgi:ATP-dependent Lon protease
MTIAVALTSLVKDIPCPRDTARTGEVTLSGRSLPVCGIREKLLAAKTAGIKTIIFPAKNQAEISAMDDSLKQEIKIFTAGELDDVIRQVLG